MAEYLAIGGAHHGQTIDAPAAVVTITASGEPYIAIGWKEGEARRQQQLFMRCGMAPAEAIRQWRALTSESRSA